MKIPVRPIIGNYAMSGGKAKRDSDAFNAILLCSVNDTFTHMVTHRLDRTKPMCDHVAALS